MGNSDTKMKPRHNGVHESLKERNDAIYRDYMDGVCVVDLADKYGVSGSFWKMTRFCSSTTPTVSGASMWSKKAPCRMNTGSAPERMMTTTVMSF